MKTYNSAKPNNIKAQVHRKFLLLAFNAIITSIDIYITNVSFSIRFHNFINITKVHMHCHRNIDEEIKWKQH